jgi:protein-arginine kinase activator protein McsA
VRTDETINLDYQLIKKWQTKKLKRSTKREKEIIIKDLRQQLDDAISKWEFEKATIIRDQLKELQNE